MNGLLLSVSRAERPSLHTITLRGLPEKPQSATAQLRYAETGRLLPAAHQPTSVSLGISPANPDDYRLQFTLSTGELPARTWLEITLDGILYTHGPLLVTT